MFVASTSFNTPKLGFLFPFHLSGPLWLIRRKMLWMFSISPSVGVIVEIMTGFVCCFLRLRGKKFRSFANLLDDDKCLLNVYKERDCLVWIFLSALGFYPFLLFARSLIPYSGWRRSRVLAAPRRCRVTCEISFITGNPCCVYVFFSLSLHSQILPSQCTAIESHLLLRERWGPIVDVRDRNSSNSRSPRTTDVRSDSL